MANLARVLEDSRQKVFGALKRSRISGEFSDLVITCGDDVHKVHKVIVCHRSEFFARAVKFGGKETEEGIIDLPDDEPAMIALLVQYLYEAAYTPILKPYPTMVVHRTELRSTEYDREYSYSFPHSCTSLKKSCGKWAVCPHHICGINCSKDCQGFTCNKCFRPTINGTADQLLTHAKLYELADKYSVDGLKELSCEKFALASAAFWDDPAFPVAAHYVYTTTMEEDTGMRDVVISVIAEHVELIRNSEIQALMAEFSTLSFGVLLKKADEHGWGLKK